MGDAIAITDVSAGPAGLVVVTVRLPDGTRRRMVLPPKLAGTAEIEWSAKAVAVLAQIQAAHP